MGVRQVHIRRNNDCALRGLIVRFGFAMLDMAGSLHSCAAANREAGKLMRATFEDFIKRAKISAGINEVARRYARNLANGRWLWRNQREARTGFPIAIEPLGASLEQQEFYRPGKASSFEMFKRLAQIDPDSEEGMFCIAALDRGGVYGESDKKE